MPTNTHGGQNCKFKGEIHKDGKSEYQLLTRRWPKNTHQKPTFLICGHIPPLTNYRYESQSALQIPHHMCDQDGRPHTSPRLVELHRSHLCVSVVHLILMNEVAAVQGPMVDHHVEVRPGLKLPLPVGNGGEWGYDQERSRDSSILSKRRNRGAKGFLQYRNNEG